MIDNLTFFQSLLAFLIILTPIVFVHELGHFIFARLFGVEVEKNFLLALAQYYFLSMIKIKQNGK